VREDVDRRPLTKYGRQTLENMGKIRLLALLLAPFGGTSATESCPLGSYINTILNSASSICDICPTGRYSDQPGAIDCTTCPTDRTSVPGSTSADACCVAGNVGNQSSCSVCDLGRYDHDANATSPCESCPAHTYQDQPGTISCIVCPAGRTAPPGVSSVDQCCPAGTENKLVGIIYQRWHDIGGTDVATLLNHEKLLSPPDVEEVYSDYFESPTNICDQCGTKMEGFFSPAVSGLHTFKIAADDNAHLWFGETKEIALANSEIASIPGWTSAREWDKYASQTSSPIDLTSDQLYFIRAVANEGSGGDNLAVGVTTPCGDLYPIPVAGTDAHTYLYYSPMQLTSALPSRGENSASTSQCSACDPGRYDHDADSTSACEGCPADTFQDQPGAVGCIACPAGHTSVHGSSVCCLAGTASIQSACSVCDPGRYDHDAKANSPCESCPVDTYQDQPGTVGCTTCPNGRTSVPGSSSAGGCCPAGNVGNQSACSACDRATITTQTPPRLASAARRTPTRISQATPNAPPALWAAHLCLGPPPPTRAVQLGILAATHRVHAATWGGMITMPTQLRPAKAAQRALTRISQAPPSARDVPGASHRYHLRPHLTTVAWPGPRF
jgi:hypothetical protein